MNRTLSASREASRLRRRLLWSLVTLLAVVIIALVIWKKTNIREIFVSMATTPLPDTASTVVHSPSDSMGAIIPLPVSVQPAGGTFTLTVNTTISVEPASDELKAIAAYLTGKLSPATGYPLPVQTMSADTEGAPSTGSIVLTTNGSDPSLGDEGYELAVTTDAVRLVAYKPEGLFRGVQTIRQMLPASIDFPTAQSGSWTMPTGTIRDMPRFAWRGAMLDVARHFFSVDDVKHYIDLLAYYKINRLHLHLTDDQGWRIAINSWPDLTTHGSSKEVGGGAGGFYTQDQYKDIVAYAQSRYIMIIPEIDMPGHTNAALSSYAKLNCNGVAPDLYTGTEVGFSSLCVGDEETYNFVDDVVRELAAITPGPYIHIGGDESHATSPDDYIKFVNLVQRIVKTHAKQVIGWEDIARGTLIPGAIIQNWASPELTQQGVKQGAKVIISMATKAYLDQQYDQSTPLGLHWAAYISVQTGYEWDPVTVVSGLSDSDVLGVEAPLWTETVVTMNDIEYMAFPRILGDAEIGWSAATGRSWDEYKGRLGAQGPRLTALGVNFYKAPDVPWSEFVTRKP